MARLTNTELNGIFSQVRKRSERVSDEQLTSTFVNAGLLMEAMSSEDHQIIYGRRGTGKTHALRYLSAQMQERGGLPILIDMSALGSDTSIYADTTLPFRERAVRLLADVLNEINDGLLRGLIDQPSVNLDALSRYMDVFSEAMPKLDVVGTVESENTDGKEVSTKSTVSLNVAKLASSLGLGHEKAAKTTEGHREKAVGELKYSVRFPGIGGAIQNIISLAPNLRIWVLIDEWSSLPEDVQPLLADMLRRAFFQLQTVTVKIAAIEHRSNFYIGSKTGQYVGFELGADIGLSVNLDDYLVFENDEEKSVRFFSDLFYRHVCSIATEHGKECPVSSDDMVSYGFTQDRTFAELVKACEGVPRDAIYIVSIAAQKASSRAISIPNIRQSARTFYQSDKANVVNSSDILGKLLNYIIDVVIGERNTSIFLLEVGQEDENINRLFDRRILHVKSKNGSSRDHRGKRFLVYKLDYGCYIDLVHTKRYPKDAELALSDAEAHSVILSDDLTGEVADDATVGKIEVPKDDRRSYRSAVLHLEKFYAHIDASKDMQVFNQMLSE